MSTHNFTRAFFGGRSITGGQRLGQSPVITPPVRPAPLGLSAFGGHMVAPPSPLTSPPVLTAAVRAGISATRSGTFHV